METTLPIDGGETSQVSMREIYCYFLKLGWLASAALIF